MQYQPRVEVELRVKVEESLVERLMVTPHTTATEHDEYSAMCPIAPRPGVSAEKQDAAGEPRLSGPVYVAVVG